MADRTCEDCGKTFDKPFLLKRHQGRKTPCQPVVALGGGENDCRYCGRGFSSKISMYRHIRLNCKAVNNEKGPQDLAALAVQEAARAKEETASLRAEVARLGSLVERLVARAELPGVIQDKKLDGRAAMSERDQVIAAAQAARGQVEWGAAELAYLLETVGAAPLDGDVHSNS
jgi:hypothetical protein